MAPSRYPGTTNLGMTTAEKIAVTGADTTVGAELVRLLSRHERPARALARRPGAQPALTGVEWAEADLAEPRSLSRAFAGIGRLFLHTGPRSDMVRLQIHGIDAAVRCGVRQVVKLSSFDADEQSKSVLGLWHYNVERRLRESGLDFTILRWHDFMQSLLEPLVFDRGTGELRSATGDGAIPFIDARDVAAVAARVLAEDGHEGETYTLTGLRARSYGEAAEIFSRVLDRHLEHRSEDLDEAWSRRSGAGQPLWLVAALLTIAHDRRVGAASSRTTDAVQRLIGRLPRTLHQFAEDHAEILGQTGQAASRHADAGENGLVAEDR